MNAMLLKMLLNRMLWIVAGGLALAAFGQNASRITPVPSDPLELATGPIQAADTPAGRKAAAQLLARARSSYALQNGGRGFDLKVTFTTDSGGQTDYDGVWKMEDIFDPEQGRRWTATASAGYTMTRITSKGTSWAEGTSAIIPLRLHEARAALFNPIPTAANVERRAIRMATAAFRGAPVTCVLLSGSGNTAVAAPGRLWEETEECIDPQSGTLRVHSQAPGRYFVYDYTGGLRLGGHTLPGKVTVTEGGKVVSKISVDSLAQLPAADQSLFVPTEAMKARGPAVAIGTAQKIARVSGQGPIPAGVPVRPVCVFGLVTPSGQLVEAHSLQPSDPNSAAAVEDAKRIRFNSPKAAGTPPEQHFVFVIEKFAAAPVE
jgi:hypothetical protein